MKTHKTIKKPVAPTIKALEVGESSTFPVTRYSVVSSSIYMVETTTGRKFTREKVNKSVVVTRVN